MNPFNALAAVIDRPETLTDAASPEGLGRTALFGYGLGTLGLFVFLRLFSLVPPGVLSFLLVLCFVLAGNLLFAAVTHLFMELTGVRGSAARLFQVFGCSDYFLALLVPLGFFSRLDYIDAFLCFCLCFGFVIYSRVLLVRRLYPVSFNKAALAIWLPYAGFTGLFFLGFVYAIAWLVWLVI